MKNLRYLVSCLLLISTFLFIHLRSSADEVPIGKPLRDLPISVGDWRLKESAPIDEASLNILKLSDYANLRYVDPQGRSLWLYVGYWESQRKGAQIHSPKNCLPGSGWAPVESSKLTIPLDPPDGPITVNKYLIQKDQSRELVLYWYQSRKTVNAGEISARIQMVKNSLFANRSDGALVRISCPVSGSVDDTTALLVGFTKLFYPELIQFLPQ